MVPTTLSPIPVRCAVSALIFPTGSVPGRRMSPNSLCRSNAVLGRVGTIPRRITPPSRSSASVVALFAERKTKAKKFDVVVPDPDYRIPLVLLGSAGLLVYQDNLLAAAPAGLLGLLLLFQEVKIGSELEESGENVFVGGKNCWKYSTFVNWELWWPNFPILVYFKETQTKPEGQVHFFPVIFNGKQLYNVMVERAGPSKTSGPKQD